MLKFISFFLVVFCLCGSMPSPFVSELRAGDKGMLVELMQALLLRSPYVDAAKLGVSGNFDAPTAAALVAFRAGHSLAPPNASAAAVTFDGVTAATLLDAHERDGVVDSAALTAASYGLLYKISVPVHRNRSIETNATLYDANNTALMSFVVRAHGHDFANDPAVWPEYSDTVGLNQFSNDGATPTGVMLCDLNSPEPSS